MRYIIENNRSAVAVHDRDLKYIYVSQRYLQEYRVKEQNIIGRHHYDVFPDLPQKWRDVHQKALAGEILSAEDDPYEREDGTVEWTRWECRPWYEVNGSIGGIIIYTEVITGRKQAEEALRVSEEKFRNLFNNSEVGMFRSRLDGLEILDFNEKFLKILNRTREEVKGSPSVIHWADPQERDEMVRRLQTDGYVTDFECGMLNKQGELRKCITSLRLYPALCVLEGSILDITDRKLAEETLHKSEALYHDLVETAQDLIWQCDPEGRYIYLNSSWQNVFGYEVEEMLGKKFTDFQSKEQALIDSKEFARLLEGNSVKGLETIHIGKAGNEINLIFNAVFVKDKDGNIVGTRGTAYDITERKLAGDKIKALLTEKELILKEVHHRIKNNMNIIKSLLNLQAETLNEPTAVTALNDAGNRILSMMLLYDKLYQSTTFNEMSINEYLPDLINQIVKNFHNSWLVKIEHYIDDFILDSKKLSTLGIIINELLTNIMKYAFTDKTEGIITVSALLEGSRVSIIINDNGIGMPESIDFENSTGFGLMLVKMLTKQLQGVIRIEKENGTRVILEFEK